MIDDAKDQLPPGRVIALDFGRVHTGVAVSDPSGTIARPLPEINDAASDAGIAALATLVEQEGVAAIIVGMPVSLSGDYGAQAEETSKFIEKLIAAVKVPVLARDERFTSKIARQRGRGSSAPEHSIAACCLLEEFLSAGKPGPR